MDDTFDVAWSRDAVDDLEAIKLYISEQGAPKAAGKLETTIRSEVAKLKLSPYRMFINKKRELRRCVVGNYLIVFRIYEKLEPKLVMITQIIYGKRNLQQWIR